MENNLGRLLLYGVLGFIGIQMLFESACFEKDFQMISQVPVMASYSMIFIRISGVFLILSGLMVVLFNQKFIEKLLFAVLFFSVATVYNPAVTNYNIRSLVNVSLLGGLALQKREKKKEKLQ
jgi:hypothetical protein